MGGGSSFCLMRGVATRRRCLGLKTLVLLGFRFLVGGDVSGRCLLSAVSLSAAEAGAASAGRDRQANRQARMKSKVSKNGVKCRV
jgi:hypothetical protein